MVVNDNIQLKRDERFPRQLASPSATAELSWETANARGEQAWSPAAARGPDQHLPIGVRAPGAVGAGFQGDQPYALAGPSASSLMVSVSS